MSPSFLMAGSKNISGNLNFNKGIYIEGGYFTARRSDFKDIYESKLSTGISFDYKKSSKFGFGARIYLNYHNREQVKLNLYSISVVPYVFYNMGHIGKFHFVIGTGTGIGYRKVRFTYGTNQLGETIDVSFSDSDIDLLGVVLTGFDFSIKPRYVVGFRAYFDYFYTGDPTTGAFGDTGGFHLMGRFGYLL